MPIDNPEDIRFSNEIIRPLCEEARALIARIGQCETRWFAGHNISFTNDSAPVLDGREDETVSSLTGADVNNVMAQLIAIKTNSNTEIIEKPCVRPLEVN